MSTPAKPAGSFCEAAFCCSIPHLIGRGRFPLFVRSPGGPRRDTMCGELGSGTKKRERWRAMCRGGGEVDGGRSERRGEVWPERQPVAQPVGSCELRGFEVSRGNNQIVQLQRSSGPERESAPGATSGWMGGRGGRRRALPSFVFVGRSCEVKHLFGSLESVGTSAAVCERRGALREGR